MADGHHFSEAFLRRCESGEGYNNLLQELLDLSSTQRSELAEVLIERKIRRAGKDGH